MSALDDLTAEALQEWRDKYGQGVPRVSATGRYLHIGLGWNGDTIPKLQGPTTSDDARPNSDVNRMAEWAEAMDALIAIALPSRYEPSSTQATAT